MTRKNSFFWAILKINRTVFPYLVYLTFFFLLLESYMYIGFLKKFFLVDSRFFLGLSIFSAITILCTKSLWSSFAISTIESLILDLNTVLFLPLAIFYLIMVASDSVRYPNYVFATFHIQPQNFLNVVLLSLSLFLFRYILNKKDNYFGDTFKRIKEYTYAPLNRKPGVILNWEHSVMLMVAIIFLLLASYIVSNLSVTLNTIINDLVFIATHPNYSYDQKMEKTWGFYYDYLKFIKENTPPTATILIPPQDGHWLSTGNEWLDRYFLYPRYLVQGSDYNVPSDGYDYVLISKGEWPSADIDWGWPKVLIKAEYIQYIDPKTLKITKINKNFNPDSSNNMQAWGLIKVRKDLQR